MFHCLSWMRKGTYGTQEKKYLKGTFSEICITRLGIPDVAISSYGYFQMQKFRKVYFYFWILVADRLSINLYCIRKSNGIQICIYLQIYCEDRLLVGYITNL